MEQTDGCPDSEKQETLALGPSKLIKFSDVPKLRWLPDRRNGARMHASTVHRWCTTGRDGKILRFLCVGGTRCTTEEWLQEFFDPVSTSSKPVESAGSNSVRHVRHRAATAARTLTVEGF